MIKGLFILRPTPYRNTYPPEILEQIEALVDIYAPLQTADDIGQHPNILRDAEVIFTGWGAPLLDEQFLQHAPHLKRVFHGAGGIKSMVTDAFWERDIIITSAYAANAIPVAEYALSQILFTLKNGWQLARAVKERGAYPPHSLFHDKVRGAYGSTVGLVSLGGVARHLIQMLQHVDVNLIAYDPFVSQEDAERLHVELCSLEELFERSDVVSVHTPLLNETRGMITGKLVESMKPWASLINTSRGAVINEPEMIDVLSRRPDLQAVIDVTYPEPPVPGSPLYSLPNVVLTPHIAGSMNGECARMGSYVVEELRRYMEGKPQKWGLSRKQAEFMA